MIDSETIKKKMMKVKILSLLIVCLILSACKEGLHSSVPDTVVNFSCSLQQSPYSYITAPGQFLTVTKNGSGFIVQAPGQEDYKDGKVGVYLGFGGLIIGHSALPMNVNSQYVAYDRACPYEADDLVISRLVINSNREAKCPKCNTVYDLDTGFPKGNTGPSKERLKTYAVDLRSTPTGSSLSIRN